MTRGWVLPLLNIRLHVKGFNKLIYILEPTPRRVFLANDTWVGFAIIKYQIACKGI